MSPEISFQTALNHYYTPPTPISKFAKKGRATPINQDTTHAKKKRKHEDSSPIISKTLIRSDLLMFNGEQWGVVDVSNISDWHPSDKVFQDTMEKVVSLNPEMICKEHLLSWINDFNRIKTMSEIRKKHISPVKFGRMGHESDDLNQTGYLDDGNDKLDVKNVRVPLRFNSMNQYAWLSNFFQTLIYDEENGIIYPSVESGYVAFKARKAEKTAEEVASFAHIINPKEAKQEGFGIWVRSSPEDNKDAVKEMRRLVTLKFQQNPFIAEWLQQTPPPFEEFTNDHFWGSAMGTGGWNKLGKIIEDIREILSTENSCAIALEF